MKKKLTYIFSLSTVLLALGLALLQGCTRIDPAESLDPADAITFAPTISNTKALLDAADLNRAGTKIQVYDNITGFNGKIGNTTIDPSQTIEYFSNEITYDADNTTYWPYCSPATSYPWTRNGTHMFHGWLTQDYDGNTAASFFDNGFSYVNRVLTIGTKKLTIDSPQFDFSYSDVTSIDASTREPGNNTVVPLHLKHLFGAIGITIKNISKDDVKVYSVRLRNFPNRAGATLTYTLGPTPSVATVINNLESSGGGDYWTNKITTPIILRNINHADGNKIYDAYTGTELTNGAEPNYRMSWPMTYAALEPTVSSVDDDGIPTYTSESPTIEVIYGSTTGEGKTFTYRFPKVDDLTTSAITAGKKYRLDLSFADKQVLVNYKILPWDWEEYPMAYEGDAISTTQLKFTAGTYVSLPKVTTDDGVKHDVVQLKANSDAGSYIAKGTFNIYTPVNGILSVSTSGNTEDFIVSLDSGHVPSGIGSGNTSIPIDPHRAGGAQITLTVRPNETSASGSRIFLHFSVRNNGRDSDADSEINRDNWMITIP